MKEIACNPTFRKKLLALYYIVKGNFFLKEGERLVARGEGHMLLIVPDINLIFICSHQRA